MSIQEDFLRKQSVGSVFAMSYEEVYGNRKHLQFLMVDKVLENGIACFKMKEVEGKLEKVTGRDSDPAILSFDIEQRSGCIGHIGFYDTKDPALKKIRTEVEEFEKKIEAVFFLRRLKESQITPEILSLVSEIQGKVENKKGKNKTSLTPSKKHISEKER